jgi:MFS family permease
LPGQGLSSDERRSVTVLALPAAALALAATAVSVYLPPVAQGYIGSTTAIGLLIGAEGIMALWLPYLVGRSSDRRGSRLPYIALATPPLVVALALLGLAGSVLVVVPLVLAFYAAYFVAYDPYRTMYSDVIRDEVAGRAQSTQAVARGVGTFVALAAGGALLGLAVWLPFTAAAVVVAVVMAVFLRGARGLAGRARRDGAGGGRSSLREVLAANPKVRTFLAANSLWELSLAALKTFIFIYVTDELGLASGAASLAIGLGAAGVLAGSAASGVLADRLGARRLMTVAVVVFGGGMAVPLLAPDPLPVALAAPAITFAGGVLLSLPYALLQPLMPGGDRGALTGLFGASRGVGTSLGPILAGLAIDLGGEPRFMWLVAGLAALVSVPLLRRL